MLKTQKSVKNCNLFKDSGNLLSSAWKSFKRNAIIEKSKIDGPDNKLKTFLLTVDKNGLFEHIICKAVPGKTYKFSVWMKSTNGKPQSVPLIGENSKPAN